MFRVAVDTANLVARATLVIVRNALYFFNIVQFLISLDFCACTFVYLIPV